MLDAGLREAEGARPAGDSGRGAQAQVTVVIAVWGDYGDDRLDDAIRSIRAQEISVEILLVDNGGDVSSGRGGVSVLRSQNRLTLGAVRNLGLRAVETPTVLFWDADDIMLEGTLRRLLAALEEEPDLVACATSLIDARTGRRHHWPGASAPRRLRQRSPPA